jgi:glutamate-ammonia-ligase adenylyltransferase
VSWIEQLIDGDLAPSSSQVPALLNPLVRKLLAGPSPRRGLLNLRKLHQEVEPGAWPQQGNALEAVASVLSSGPEMGRLLARRPARLRYLLDPSLGRQWDRSKLAEDLDQRLANVDTAEELAGQLARFRNDHFVRLAACEFGATSLEQVGLELSTLADLCLDRAIEWTLREVAREVGHPEFDEEGAGNGNGSQLAAVAMGKHGAQELNFCSDIDLVFIYRSDRGQAGALSLHEFFTRVCRQVTAMLSNPTVEGTTFRVDLRLRPEGSRGPLCNSLASAERYYETWGGPFDRLAWLKARPSAGDMALGERMVELMKPFVFPRATRPEVVEEIQQLFERISANLPVNGEGGWNVKLGPGGIRAVEFFVQSLQLVHAGKHEALRERSTLRALDQLLFSGFISELEHRQLSEAYDLWRRIEHRLQLHDGRQTHLLPTAGTIREQVVAHMGYRPEAFDQELHRRRSQVQQIFDTLGAGTQQEETGLALLLERDLGPDEVVRCLESAGFAQPEQAMELLSLLGSKPWGPLGIPGVSRCSHLALPLLVEIARSPDPDAALRHFSDFSLKFGSFSGVWAMLDENRNTLRLLCSLFGSSDFLARLFIKHPELLDQLLMAGRARRIRELREMREELAARLQAIDPDHTEARLNGLRRFRNQEVLRIGLNDVAGGLELEQTWQQLSALAQVVLEQAYPLVLSDAQSRYGVARLSEGPPAQMAVIALGKLGGRELTYASDLDLIFIFSGAGATAGPRRVENQEFFARVAHRLINALSTDLEEGRLYEVDTRLRPSGQQGTLVSSWPAFMIYHEQTSQLWERQVLIKARSVAGDRQLGRQIDRWVQDYLFSPDTAVDPQRLRHEIDRHRRRMEKELAAENGAFYNLKLGRGGLLDIDFIAQYYQLWHGARSQRLRAHATLETLTALAEEGLLDPHSAATLIRSYRFLRRIESRLRIVRDRSAERLPADARGLEVMARRLGYRGRGEVTPGERLLAEYKELTEAVRGIYETVFR